MSDAWLTIEAAARRLGVSERSVRRYASRDGLRIRLGLVRESELLAAERAARERQAAGRATVKKDKLADAVQAFASSRRLDEAQRTLVLDFAKFARTLVPDGPHV